MNDLRCEVDDGGGRGENFLILCNRLKKKLYDLQNTDISFLKNNMKYLRRSRIQSSLQGLHFIDHYTCSLHISKLPSPFLRQQHSSPFICFICHLFSPQANSELKYQQDRSALSLMKSCKTSLSLPTSSHRCCQEVWSGF